MSGSFDSLQTAIATHPNREVRTALRFAIQALHDWDHGHEGVLNTDRAFAIAADKAEQTALALADGKKEEESAR